MAGTVDAALRQRSVDDLGNAALVDAIAVASGFNAINMVADATGIPLDGFMGQRSDSFREAIGIEAYRSAS